LRLEQRFPQIALHRLSLHRAPEHAAKHRGDFILRIALRPFNLDHAAPLPRLSKRFSELPATARSCVSDDRNRSGYRPGDRAPVRYPHTC
jgi:hypothetical protein